MEQYLQIAVIILLIAYIIYSKRQQSKKDRINAKKHYDLEEKYFWSLNDNKKLTEEIKRKSKKPRVKN